MPRTTTLESPGCPPLRTLTFDSLGLVKVIESRTNQGIPQVVERWGEPDSSKCVLAASIDDCQNDPLLAVVRKCGTVEVINPLNGNIHAEISNFSEDEAIVDLHLFRKQRLSGSCTLLTCTSKGNASIRSVAVNNKADGDNSTAVLKALNICASGNILFSVVHGMENYALFGGKGVEVNIWDLEQSSKIWNAKPPPKNSLGIFTPTWFTAATFLTNKDHHKFVAGTNSNQVRLYDISAQRRPVISVDFRETPIKAVAEDQDGYTVYIGNGSGDLASIDLRTGKLLGCFIGKCSGSIRSIARHPELPVLASCGLDSYLRLWDTNTRQLLSATFLKQHLTKVVFDSNFCVEEKVATDAESVDEVQTDNEEESDMPVRRKKSSKSKEGSRKKTLEAAAEAQNKFGNKSDDDVETPSAVKKKNSSKSKQGSRKKTSEVAAERNDNKNKSDDKDEELRVKRKRSSKSKEGKSKEKVSSKRSNSKKKSPRVESEMNDDECL